MPLEINAEVHLIFSPPPSSWFCPWGDSGVGVAAGGGLDVRELPGAELLLVESHSTGGQTHGDRE